MLESLCCLLTCCCVVYEDDKKWYSIRRLPKSVCSAEHSLMQDFPWMSEYSILGVKMIKSGIPFAGYPRVMFGRTFTDAGFSLDV